MPLPPIDLNKLDARCKAADDNWYTLTNWKFHDGIPSVIKTPESAKVEVIYRDGKSDRLLAKNVAWSQVERFCIPEPSNEERFNEAFGVSIGGHRAPLVQAKPAPAPEVKVRRVEALFPHYHKDVSHLDSIDVYRVIDLWEVTDPCIQHAIKKLLVGGARGHKSMAKDVHEAIVSLQRWEEMQAEDEAAR